MIENNLRPIDRQFGVFIHRISDNPTLATLAQLVSQALERGDICIDLNHPELLPEDLQPDTSTLNKWKAELSKENGVVAQNGERCPLVFDGQRLYLHRYWNYREIIAQKVRSLLTLPPLTMSEDVLSQAKSWFNSDENFLNFGGHLQLAAGILPFRSGLSILSGGPGTGKTTVLAKILGLLFLQNPSIHIALAAPTGKAAMRMKESIQSALQRLDISLPIWEKLEKLSPSTLHRLLGYRRLSPYFKHNADNPLTADVVVIDETSMVDIAMMAKLLQSLKPDARLILLGDRYQLASVEAGSVMGDLCEAFENNYFSASFTQTVNSLIGCPENHLIPKKPNSVFQDRLILLKKSYRFKGEEGIGQSSALVNEGKADAAIDLMKQDTNCRFEPLQNSSDILSDIIRHYEPLHQSTSVEIALNQLNDFKVLCALRKGSLGVEAINFALHTHFSEKKHHRFYNNLPILIRKNSPSQNLFNGDTGIIRKDPNGNFKAWFYNAEGNLIRFLPSLLPEYQIAYAMTIHKSQGSEFKEVFTLLPEKPYPLVSRELIYTAITRAKEKSVLFCSENSLRQGIAQTTLRISGLKEAVKLCCIELKGTLT